MLVPYFAEIPNTSYCGNAADKFHVGTFKINFVRYNKYGNVTRLQVSMIVMLTDCTDLS